MPDDYSETRVDEITLSEMRPVGNDLGRVLASLTKNPETLSLINQTDFLVQLDLLRTLDDMAGPVSQSEGAPNIQRVRTLVIIRRDYYHPDQEKAPGDRLVVTEFPGPSGPDSVLVRFTNFPPFPA